VVHLAVLPDSIQGGDLASESSDRVVILQAVGALPIQMRAAVVLRYYADLPVEAVAAALGKSPNTIKAQLQTALNRLRRTLAEPALAAGETSHA
jgi:RNA polymerase sigma factor (sigma-70 family)